MSTGPVGGDARPAMSETTPPGEADAASPITVYFDEKFRRSRELLVFMEESKIWQDLLQDCVDRAGVNASLACRQLHEIVEERNRYHRSNFNAAMRPKRTVGIPPYYERRVRERDGD